MPREHRQERIADLLREQIARILHEEFVPPENSVLTVTRVDVAEDLDTATVLTSIFPDTEGEEALERLENFAGEVQFRLMKLIRFKPIPRITFALDKGIAHADDINQKLYRIRENDVG